MKLCDVMTPHQVLQYVGMPNVRRKLIKSIPKFDLVVMSYETLRSDADALSSQVP